MQVEEIKRLAKLAIDAFSAEEIKHGELSALLDEVESDLVEGFNQESLKLKRFKPSELVRVSKNSLNDIRDALSSDLMKGKVILSTVALSSDALLDLSPLDNITSPTSSQLENIIQFGEQGYSAQVLAQEFDLVVEDVEEFLNVQGVK